MFRDAGDLRVDRAHFDSYRYRGVLQVWFSDRLGGDDHVITSTAARDVGREDRSCHCGDRQVSRVVQAQGRARCRQEPTDRAADLVFRRTGLVADAVDANVVGFRAGGTCVGDVIAERDAPLAVVREVGGRVIPSSIGGYAGGSGSPKRAIVVKSPTRLRHRCRC